MESDARQKTPRPTEAKFFESGPDRPKPAQLKSPDSTQGQLEHVHAKSAHATYLTYRSLALILAHMPEPVAQRIPFLVGQLVATFSRKSREINSSHFRRLLAAEFAELATLGEVGDLAETTGVKVPGIEPDAALVRRWSRRSFKEYVRYWVEGARLPNTSPEEVVSRMRVEQGFEHLERATLDGKGTVMAIPHVGSWEWGGTYLAISGFPMTAVAERIEPEELFQWFVKEREAMGISIVALGSDSGTHMLRTLRKGGLVGLLCDRDIQGNGVEVEYFGERTTLPAGPATLALRTGAALLPTVVFSGPGNLHTGHIGAPLDTTRRGSLRDDVARLTQEIAVKFEQFILRAPEQWHLFQPNWPSD